MPESKNAAATSEKLRAAIEGPQHSIFFFKREDPRQRLHDGRLARPLQARHAHLDDLRSGKCNF